MFRKITLRSSGRNRNYTSAILPSDKLTEKMVLPISFSTNSFFTLQLIQDLKKENFDLKLRLFMEQKEREVGQGEHAL